MSRTVLAVAVLAAAFTSACGDDGPNSPSSLLGFDFTALPPLQNGFHYEGWAIVDGSPRSTGKFNVAADGSLRTVGGQELTGGFRTGLDLEGASAFTITIEPAGDTDAVPAATKVLAGPVSGRSAALTAEGALGSFASASGVFILATPTDGPGTNETSGIWFIDPSSGTPRPGLSLPALPEGWQYEGWAVVNDLPLTTGKFLRPEGADFAAPFSGPLPGPPFPGEDYLANAPAGVRFPLSLAGSMAVITIEPSPDDSPMPYRLRPLLAPVPAGAAPMLPFALGNGRAEFPRGTASF